MHLSLRTTDTARWAWRLLAVSALILLLGLTACGSADREPAPSETISAAVTGDTYVTIDVQTAHDRLDATPEAQLVDVREPTEWESTGVPPGALLIPLGEIERRAPAELAKDRPVYVICRSGNRSRTASETLVRLGYTDVYNVDGGIQAWISAGLPVEAYKP